MKIDKTKSKIERYLYRLNPNQYKLIDNENLYLYKLKEDGVLYKYIINSYYKVITNTYAKKLYYIFQIEGQSTIYTIEDNNIDRFVSSRILSFNDNIEDAYDIVMADLVVKRDDYYKKYCEAQHKINKVKENISKYE